MGDSPFTKDEHEQQWHVTRVDGDFDRDPDSGDDVAAADAAMTPAHGVLLSPEQLASLCERLDDLILEARGIHQQVDAAIAENRRIDAQRVSPETRTAERRARVADICDAVD